MLPASTQGSTGLHALYVTTACASSPPMISIQNTLLQISESHLVTVSFFVLIAFRQKLLEKLTVWRINKQ